MHLKSFEVCHLFGVFVARNEMLVSFIGRCAIENMHLAYGYNYKYFEKVHKTFQHTLLYILVTVLFNDARHQIEPIREFCSAFWKHIFFFGKFKEPHILRISNLIKVTFENHHHSESGTVRLDFYLIKILFFGRANLVEHLHICSADVYHHKNWFLFRIKKYKFVIFNWNFVLSIHIWRSLKPTPKLFI